jgi:uncharacterized protein YecE (DUF72 family)
MILIGTSGWQYASWRGRFYPPGLPQRAWLAFYTERFPVVEVNNSFYILPREETFDRWRDSVPPGFLFALKASRFITHIRRLRNCADPVELFWSRATRLGDRLGPVLFQLPPRFRADVPLLSDFLALLPPAMRAAFEFRDHSWRTDEVLDLLDRAGAAWVMADRPGWRVPTVVTGGWSYLRFHQGQEHHPAYTREKLARWADRIAGLGDVEVYAFFNNDPEAAAPRDAATLAELLRRRGCRVAEPPLPVPA